MMNWNITFALKNILLYSPNQEKHINRHSGENDFFQITNVYYTKNQLVKFCVSFSDHCRDIATSKSPFF